MDTFVNRTLLLLKPSNLIWIITLSLGVYILISGIGAIAMANLSFGDSPVMRPLENVFRAIYSDKWHSEALRVAGSVVTGYWPIAGKQLKKADRMLCARPWRSR
ncbi:hypothetical protein ACFSSA_09250 [Luteolibacter algae]|uniref:Uncharacterized protein n=1 Tax=Luteolibacter algae TaxID=454151 RepID=A0ABW5D9W6_9BACT